jgi:hypothetical protein
MKLFVSFIVVSILFISCNESNSNAEKNLVDSKSTSSATTDYKDYFFPSDSLIPYIYVFQSSQNPLDEKIFRIYKLQNNKDTSLVVERYNANFKITEGFTHDLSDSLKLSDYMIVDGDGTKRKANVLSNKTFPLDLNETAYFVADFPAPMDSVSIIYESKKNIAEVNLKKIVLDDTVDVLRVVDSVKVHLVNPFSKKSNTKLIVTNRYYAKGYGLVEWGSDELNIHYRLTKILSDEWWMEYAQGPQVKM